LKSRLDRQEATIRQLQNDNKEFGEYQRTLLEKEKRKNADLLAELEVRRATAINDGDGQAFTQIDREIQQVRRDMDVPPPRPNGQDLDPLAQAWLLNNDWYNTNTKLQIFADGLSEQIAQQGYSGPAYYSELTRRVREEFPEEFQNKRKAHANTVEQGGELDTENPLPRTYDNLPPDAKAACDRFVKGGFTTKEDYVANYEWDE
jgi:hypothetical protein